MSRMTKVEENFHMDNTSNNYKIIFLRLKEQH
jgi:hypothetical protein